MRSHSPRRYTLPRPAMPKKTLPSVANNQNATDKVANAILAFLGKIPDAARYKDANPSKVSREIAINAAAKAARTAGFLALPPGPIGWLTILPELIAVWKIQAQMVSDIAAVYGKKSTLTQEQMLYCLFRHTAAQAVRDVVVRVGERFLVRRASLKTLQMVAQRVGVHLTQRAIGKGIARWLPIVGAAGVGAYAYYDTGQVAATAIELFEKEITIEQQAGEVV